MRKLLWIAACFLGVLGALCACSESISTPSAPELSSPANSVASKAMDAAAQGKLKVGFVYVGGKDDDGWSNMHHIGKEYLAEQEPDIEIIEVENVPEDNEVAQTMQNLIDEGCHVIFAASFGYGDYVLDVAKDNPETIFFHCSGYKTSDNVATYFGQIELPRYLAGMVAGAQSKNGQIGYVAAYPLPEVIRGINAFTMGAQSANPDAKVYVSWTNTWCEASLERELTFALIDEKGCDVIAQHQDTPTVITAAAERGVYGIGNNKDMSAELPESYLTAPVWNWGPYYVRAIHSVKDGSFQGESFWGNLTDGIVELGSISDLVDEDVRKEVETLEQEWIANNFSFEQLFAGPLSDNMGHERLREGENLSFDGVLNMDWFVEGVEGSVTGQ